MNTEWVISGWNAQCGVVCFEFVIRKELAVRFEKCVVQMKPSSVMTILRNPWLTDWDSHADPLGSLQRSPAPMCVLCFLCFYRVSLYWSSVLLFIFCILCMGLVAWNKTMEWNNWWEGSSNPIHLVGGLALASINEVNQRRARLVLRWVTVSGFNSQWGTFISVCDQPPRSTQPGHLFVGRRNEYQPKGGDALWLGSKGRYGSCVGGR